MMVVAERRRDGERPVVDDDDRAAAVLLVVRDGDVHFKLLSSALSTPSVTARDACDSILISITANLHFVEGDASTQLDLFPTVSYQSPLSSQLIELLIINISQIMATRGPEQ